MDKDRICKNCYWFSNDECYDSGLCLLYGIKKESESCNDWEESDNMENKKDSYFFIDNDVLEIDINNFDKLYFEKGKLKINLKVNND